MISKARNQCSVLAVFTLLACTRPDTAQRKSPTLPSPAYAVQQVGFVYSQTLQGYFDKSPEFSDAWDHYFGAESFKIEAQIQAGKVVKWKALSPYSERIPQEWLFKLFANPVTSYKGRLDGQHTGFYVLFLSNCNVGGMVGVGLFPESGPSLDTP